MAGMRCLVWIVVLTSCSKAAHHRQGAEFSQGPSAALAAAAAAWTAPHRRQGEDFAEAPSSALSAGAAAASVSTFAAGAPAAVIDPDEAVVEALRRSLSAVESLVSRGILRDPARSEEMD